LNSIDNSTIKKQTFDEKYQRVTTYIDRKLYTKIQSLKKQGKLEKMTDFINLAIKEYLEKSL